MKGIIIVMTGLTILLLIYSVAQGNEVAFTREDRERLIRVEVTLKEFKDAVDKRFEQVDKRFEQVEQRFGDMISFMSIITGIFTAIMIANMGFAYWDRRTIIRKAKMESVEEIERSGKLKDIIYALRELAKKNSDVAEILQKFHLL